MLKIQSSPDSETLTNEQLVTLRHKLEDNIIWFLSELENVESRDIELITAQIVDAAEKETVPSEKKAQIFKADLLRAYYALRQKGERRFLRGERFLEVFVDAKIIPPGLKLDELPTQEEVDRAVTKLSK